MTDPIRWGVLGTGHIARVFTEDLLRLPGHEVTAVGSRSAATAAAFADRHGVATAHGSWADLAADDRLDVVYVATPHTAHLPAARACLTAGRNVLVEKPFATNAADAAELIALARERGRFAMEAMWTRFNPLVRRLRALVAEGAIGRIEAVYADFSFLSDFDPEHRLWAAELAGGALLDIGVYPVSFASMLLGAPSSVLATAAAAPTGVDANTGILLGHDSGAVALLHCGLRADSPQTATVVGTEGRLELPTPFYNPTSLVLHRPGTPPETFTCEFEGHGYGFQAREVADRLREGALESPAMPLDETRAVLETLDAVAAAISGSGGPGGRGPSSTAPGS